jgi:tetratricopeptide (TPR) repeat protein
MGNPCSTEGTAEGLRVLAKVLAWQSVFSWRLGRDGIASQILEQSLALLDEVELAGQDAQAERAFALMRIGLTVFDSDHKAAQQLYEQSLALYKALGDRWGMADVPLFLSWVALSSASFDLARQQGQESLALRQSLGDRRGIALSLMILGGVAVFQGRPKEAERLQRKSYAIYRELDDRFGIARAGRNLSVALMALGRLVEACSLREESVAICSDLESRVRIAYETGGLSQTRMLLGQYEEARADAQASLALARETGTPWVIADPLHVLGWLALAEGAYAEA